MLALCAGGGAHVCSNLLSGVCVAVMGLGVRKEKGWQDCV